jgi:hypothetical protein
VGGAPGTTLAEFPRSVSSLNGVAGPGNYFARVVADGCAASGPSNEVQFNIPGNTGRVPDPPSGFVPLPDFSGLVARIAAERPDLLLPNGQCPTGRKYETNPFINFMVDRLREYDRRIGYNGKPVKTPADNNGFPVIAAGDEIAYFFGSGNPEGSPNTYLIDILFNHCGDRPEITWRHFTGEEPGIWTGAGRF